MTKRKLKPASEATPKARGRQRMQELALAGTPKNPALAIPHRELTSFRKKTFLDHLSQCGSISRAATLTDSYASAPVYRRHAKESPEFAAAIREASATYAGLIHTAVLKAAGLGPDAEKIPMMANGEPLTDKDGNIIYTTRYSERILLALSRSTNPDMADKRTVTTVDGGHVANGNEVVVSTGDLWLLNSSDSSELLRILAIIDEKKDSMGIVREPMKLISSDNPDAAIDADFVEVNESDHNPLLDSSWED